MPLSREDVLHVARLARIALSDDEVERFQTQLSDILEHFDVLRQIDTEGVPPTAHTLDLVNVERDDEVRPSMPVEDVLRNAPAREGDLFRVRAVLE
ncbi:MAG TPA: Asp-tRNA(Asn)/Glu-tRNA(Gln) amidotransferase subunit GatC [Dehalococcoidia bacterium]|jgi:aspartyl-tRNA(Asn)/glutamyl-tRNA(Gln) amidotransferase subunit C|nr:Asp-tRNA(Asn)/Glu-tRNA(Gln) amidotransferase subunit GatC [Dehalococcoidia bacterium]